MSVYKRPNSPFYWSEFWIDGIRFRLSTGEADRRLAGITAKRLKAERKAAIETQRARKASYGGREPPTMGYVVARYWQEVGQFHEAPTTTWRSLEWLTDHFGVDTLLTEITDDKITLMVARRRGIRILRDKETKRLVETPSESVKNATVNRYATEPLRKLFRRATEVWGYQIHRPKWREHLLDEPEERVREASAAEEAAIRDALGEDYGRLFDFMMATGLRSSAALLTWSKVDFVNGIARVPNKSKNGQIRWYTIPLSRRAVAILKECQGHHTEFVFTYVSKRRRHDTDDARGRSGRRVHDQGIAPGFRRHDTRHTTGTRFLRATGNLKATQKLLGHSRIETTLRYAHVLVEDVRAGLEAVEGATHTAKNTHKNTHTRRRNRIR